MSRGLRIGVVLSGQLVEERFVRTGPVTLGRSLRATISVPLDGVPREHVLFGPDRALHLAPGMTGRIAVGGEVAAASDGPLARGTRGKLELGELSLLFQDVEAPPRQPRPRLPASLRERRIDRKLAAIVGASLAAHVAIATWAWTREPAAPLFVGYHEPLDHGIDVQLPDYVDRVDPTPIAASARPGAAAPVAPQHSITPARTPSRAAASDPAELAREAMKMATILTGDDDGSNGFAATSARQPGSDLGAQIADARSHHATIGDGSHTSRADDRAHIGDGTHGIVTTEQTFETVERKDEIPTRVTIVPPQHTEPGGADVVAKITNAYVAGLQRCYQLGLRDDSALEGKVALELTVLANGRVSEPSANGVSDGVDRCIAKQMASWHFAAPREEATFDVSLILKPGR
jgi:hypothetical protein